MEGHHLFLERKSKLKGPKGQNFFMQTSVVNHMRMLCTKFGWNWPKLNFGRFLRPWWGRFWPNFIFVRNFKDLAPRTLHVKYEVIWTSGSWEEDFLRLTQFLPLLPLLGPYGAMPFSFANLKRLPMGMLCAKFGWNPSIGSWEEVEKVKKYNWSLFCPLKGPKGGPETFFMQTSVVNHMRMLCTKFGWNWPKLNFWPFSAPPGGAVFDPISFSFANFEYLAPRTLKEKWSIWTSGSWEEDF